MRTVTLNHSDIDNLVAQLHNAADTTDLTPENRDKLLSAARHLTTALENPVDRLMTIAKWPVGHGALRTALKFELFERFEGDKKTVAELEAWCGVEGLLLTRIMRVLLCMGIFQEDEEGCYHHNVLSKPLRDETIRAMIRGMSETTDIMPKLPDYLEHLKFRNPDDRNKSLFGYFHDTDLNMYEWLQINPEKMTIFNAYHEANARLWERNLQANLEHLLAPNSYNDIFGDLDSL